MSCLWLLRRVLFSEQLGILYACTPYVRYICPTRAPSSLSSLVPLWPALGSLTGGHKDNVPQRLPILIGLAWRRLPFRSWPLIAKSPTPLLAPPNVQAQRRGVLSQVQTRQGKPRRSRLRRCPGGARGRLCLPTPEQAQVWPK